jgi:predicted SAM-dependent methyltransferase
VETVLDNKGDGMKLDIGSGGPSTLGEGWYGVDHFIESADYHWAMDKLEIEDESIDEIYSCHSLEHISRHKVVPTLKEWHRVLKPGGKVTVIVPEMEFCLNVMMEACHKRDLEYWDYRSCWIYGKQDHPGNFHNCGFTSWVLDHYFRSVGFEIKQRTNMVIHNCESLKWEGIK